MKFLQVLSLSLFSLVNAGDSSGPALNTKTGKYAGTYEFVYYSATSGTTCTQSQPFTLTIPDGIKTNDTKPETTDSPSGDPVYGTTNGLWTVSELSKSNDIDDLKISVYIKDMDQKIVCWAIGLNGKTLTANLNPSVPNQCPTRYVTSPTSCNNQLAFLVGQCKKGACNGDTPVPSATASASKSSNAVVLSVSAVSTFMVAIIAFL